MTREVIQDIIEWDVNNWSLLLKQWQPIIDSLSKDSSILCIGERNGGLSLWLALNGFYVVCSDRVYPTPQAIALHKKYNVSHLISYQEYDILKAYPSDSKFDLIMAKSVLGGIKSEYSNSTSRNNEAREKAINNISHAIKDNGIILFAENMRGSFLLYFFRKISGKNKGWHYFRREEIFRLFSKNFHLKTNYFGIIPSLGNNKIINKLIYIINYLLQPLLPGSTKYISFLHGVKMNTSK